MSISPHEYEVAPRDPPAVGRILSALLRDGHTRTALAAAIAAAKREARENNLPDADIDAELAAWRNEDTA